MQDFSRYLQSRVCPSAHVGAYSKSRSLKTWSQPTSPRSSQSLKLHNLNGSPWVNSAKYLTLLSQHCENIVQWSSWLNSDAIWTLLLHLRFTPVLGNHDHFGAWVHLFAISIWSSASLLKKSAEANKILHRQCIVIVIVCLYCHHLLIQLRWFANYPENRFRFTRLFPPAVWLCGCAWYFARKTLQISSPAL